MGKKGANAKASPARRGRAPRSRTRSIERIGRSLKINTRPLPGHLAPSPSVRLFKQEGSCCHVSSVLSLLSSLPELANASKAHPDWYESLSEEQKAGSASADAITALSTKLIASVVSELAVGAVEEDLVAGCQDLAALLYKEEADDQQDAAATLELILNGFLNSTLAPPQLKKAFRESLGIVVRKLKIRDFDGKGGPSLVQVGVAQLGDSVLEWIQWCGMNSVKLDVHQELEPQAESGECEFPDPFPISSQAGSSSLKPAIIVTNREFLGRYVLVALRRFSFSPDPEDNSRTCAEVTDNLVQPPLTQESPDGKFIYVRRAAIHHRGSLQSGRYWTALTPITGKTDIPTELRILTHGQSHESREASDTGYIFLYERVSRDELSPQDGAAASSSAAAKKSPKKERSSIASSLFGDRKFEPLGSGLMLSKTQKADTASVSGGTGA